MAQALPIPQKGPNQKGLLKRRRPPDAADPAML